MTINQNSMQIKEWQGNKFLIIETDKLNDYLKFIKSAEFKEFNGIIISKDLGYKDSNLNFLHDIPFLTSISISDFVPDISAIYYLTDLKTLNLSDNKQDIDLTHFENLEELSFDWSLKLKNLDKCKNLRKLVIGKFNPKNKDLSTIPELNQLEDISIIKSSILSLNGIGKLQNLKKAEFCSMTKLENLNDLEPLSNSLEVLIFENCKKIVNKDYVKILSNLKELDFDNCGKIPSIAFIKEMKNLRVFKFVDTNVLDGDITPCIRLEYSAFFNKKHYSHTFETIEALKKTLIR